MIGQAQRLQKTSSHGICFWRLHSLETRVCLQEPFGKKWDKIKEVGEAGRSQHSKVCFKDSMHGLESEGKGKQSGMTWSDAYLKEAILSSWVVVWGQQGERRTSGLSVVFIWLLWTCPSSPGHDASRIPLSPHFLLLWSLLSLLCWFFFSSPTNMLISQALPLATCLSTFCSCPPISELQDQILNFWPRSFL